MLLSMEESTPVASALNSADGATTEASTMTTIVTVEDWEATCTRVKATNNVVVLQIGSDWCERCPAMHECIKVLQSHFRFEWFYTDAANTELSEHFEISKLPAVVIFKPGATEDGIWKQQAVAIPVVQQAVKLICPAVFVTDVDF